MKNLTLSNLYSKFEKLQLQLGDPLLNPIVGGGCLDNPNIIFTFMNPTRRNIASDKSWDGIKTPWLGTKVVWNLFKDLGYIQNKLLHKIQNMPTKNWSPNFCKHLYSQISKNKIYITNLAKCTQTDARKLPNKIFKRYLQLYRQEINILHPKLIIAFGNQVSSIILDKKISVSKVRKKNFKFELNDRSIPLYSVYYPVGQGRRNYPKAYSDLKDIIKKHI